MSDSKNLFHWKSPSRPFKKRDRDYFTTIGAMVFLIIIILFFLQEWFFIGAIISLTFLVYVLNTIPPEEVEHTLKIDGLVSAGHEYEWSQLYNFWFAKKFNHPILVIQTKMKFPGRLILLVKEEDIENIKKHLSPHLLFKEVPDKNWMDNASEWLSRKVPLDKNA